MADGESVAVRRSGARIWQEARPRARRPHARRTRKRPKELVGNHPGQQSAAAIARSPRSLPGAAGCSLAATADQLPGRPVDHSPVRFRRFSPAPSGETKCSRRRPSATTGLSTKLRCGGEMLSPKLWTSWIACGENRAPHPHRKSDKGGVCFVGSLVPPHRRRPGRLVATPRRLQPSLAVGAVPPARADQGPAPRARARPSPPRRGDRHPDRCPAARRSCSTC